MFGPPFIIMVVSVEREGDLAPLSVSVHCVGPFALVGYVVENQGVGLLDVECDGIMPLAVIGRADLYEVIAEYVHHVVSSGRGS